MGSSAETLTSSGDLPAGMWFYAFMLDAEKPQIAEHVAAGRLPVPSSLVVGMGIGLVLTAVRLLLDLAVLKVGVYIVAPVDAWCRQRKG